MIPTDTTLILKIKNDRLTKLSNLAAGSCKGVVAERRIEIVGTGMGLRRGGGGGAAAAAVRGLREASEAESGESGERAGRREPLPSL